MSAALASSRRSGPPAASGSNSRPEAIPRAPVGLTSSSASVSATRSRECCGWPCSAAYLASAASTTARYSRCVAIRDGRSRRTARSGEDSVRVAAASVVVSGAWWRTPCQACSSRICRPMPTSGLHPLVRHYDELVHIPEVIRRRCPALATSCAGGLSRYRRERTYRRSMWPSAMLKTWQRSPRTTLRRSGTCRCSTRGRGPRGCVAPLRMARDTCRRRTPAPSSSRSKLPPASAHSWLSSALRLYFLRDSGASWCG